VPPTSNGRGGRKDGREEQGMGEDWMVGKEREWRGRELPSIRSSKFSTTLLALIIHDV